MGFDQSAQPVGTEVPGGTPGMPLTPGTPTVPAAVAAMMANDSASAALGMQLVACGEGTATVAMTVRADMLNGYAIAHGGLVFALADTAFACACNSHGQVTVAAGADVTFVAPAQLGDELVAVAVERALFGRSGIYDVTVRRGSEVIAEFRGRSHRLATNTADPAH